MEINLLKKITASPHMLMTFPTVLVTYKHTHIHLWSEASNLKHILSFRKENALRLLSLLWKHTHTHTHTYTRRYTEHLKLFYGVSAFRSAVSQRKVNCRWQQQHLQLLPALSSLEKKRQTNEWVCVCISKGLQQVCKSNFAACDVCSVCQ